MVEGKHEPEKKTLPRLDIKVRINHSPHVVILGAGASRACCPSGDKNGRHLPVMADFATKVGIGEIIKEAGYDPSTARFTPPESETLLKNWTPLSGNTSER